MNSLKPTHSVHPFRVFGHFEYELARGSNQQVIGTYVYLLSLCGNTAIKNKVKCCPIIHTYAQQQLPNHSLLVYFFWFTYYYYVINHLPPFIHAHCLPSASCDQWATNHKSIYKFTLCALVCPPHDTSTLLIVAPEIAAAHGRHHHRTVFSAVVTVDAESIRHFPSISAMRRKDI